MADSFAGRKLEPAGSRSRAEVDITFDGTTATWDTGLTNSLDLDCAQKEVISGVGGGTMTPSTTVRGRVALAGFTNADVIKFVAYGYV